MYAVHGLARVARFVQRETRNTLRPNPSYFGRQNLPRWRY